MSAGCKHGHEAHSCTACHQQSEHAYLVDKLEAALAKVAKLEAEATDSMAAFVLVRDENKLLHQRCERMEREHKALLAESQLKSEGSGVLAQQYANTLGQLRELREAAIAVKDYWYRDEYQVDSNEMSKRVDALIDAIGPHEKAQVVSPLDTAVFLMSEEDVRESVVLVYAYLVGQLELTDFAQAAYVHPHANFEGKVAWILLRGALASRGEA